MKQAIQGASMDAFAVADRPQRSLIPPARELSRPQLVERIEAGMSGRLVLITAPAGWGKTSVLAEWARATALDVAWVDCARRGDGGHRLVKGIVAALDVVCPDFGKDLFAMLRSARPLPTLQLFSVLAEALEDYGTDIALVLDDFHAVQDIDTLDAVFQLVSAGPPNLRVLIASRVAPSWPLARMRVSGDLTGLGSADLAFSKQEVRSALGGGSVPDEVVETLKRRTGGWPAGAQLAKLWLRNVPDTRQLAEVVAGTHRDIGDYMAQEVLESLPADLQRYLYATSLVERFSADLASAMLREEDSAHLLEAVERHDLFLIPLDLQRRWYRYHDVFRDVLRERAGRALGEDHDDMLLRAAAWFQASGMPFDATKCFLAAGKPEDAARVLDGCARELLLRDGEAVTLIELVQHLPSTIVACFDSLQRFYAWALVLVGRLEDAERVALAVEQRAATLPPEEGQDALAESASIRSRIAAYRGDHDATIRHGLEALQCRVDGMDWFRADALLSLGFAHRARGALAEACDAFGLASQLGWRSHFANAALWGSRYQALTFTARGRLEDAAAQIDRDLHRAEEEGMVNGAAYAALLVSRGEIRYERNDLGGAREDLLLALRLAREAGDAKILMNVHVARAMLEAAEGQRQAARDAARKAVLVFDGTMEKAIAARLALMEGDLPAVRRWMESYVSSVGLEPSLQHGEAEQLMLGRAMLATGRIDEARHFLLALLDEADSSDRAGTAMLVRAVLAQAEQAAGNPDIAEEHARHVLDLTMRERYVRAVLDEGPGFVEILRRAVRHDTLPARREYARSILPPVESARANGPAVERNGIVEPLTPRQEEVLRLMADGRSNREIADELYLAEGTVKAHVHQIFNKLMVRNRAEAIRAAQHLGIAS